jgi:hypothetical protein
MRTMTRLLPRTQSIRLNGRMLGQAARTLAERKAAGAARPYGSAALPTGRAGPSAGSAHLRPNPITAVGPGQPHPASHCPSAPPFLAARFTPTYDTPRAPAGGGRPHRGADLWC